MSTSSGSGSSKDEKQLGDYVLQNKKLGSGSYAEVYLGYRKKDGIAVAIKVISKDRLNKKLLQNLETEIETLKSISHPNIIKLFEVYRSSKRHVYMIMEYCAGGTLSQYIRDVVKGPLPEVQIKKFLGNIVRGLAYMNTKKLIHRDLKPQNILLTEYKNPELKIADFGFARYLVDNDMAETQCGTPLYMSPEVIKSEKYDARADLWALGIILYEMFHGKVPFGANNMITLLKVIENQSLEFKNVSEKAIDLIKKLLVIDMEQRISFEDFMKHPYVVDCLAVERKISNPEEMLLAISPRSRPKSSPFKEVKSEVEKQEDFFMVDKSQTTLASMFPTIDGGSIQYPTVIFDFTGLKYNKDNKEMVLTISKLESFAKQAWALAELAYILEKSDPVGSFGLYTSALLHFYQVLTFNSTLSKELSCERLNALIGWINSRYQEFAERALSLSNNLANYKDEITCTEDLLYRYALKNIKEASSSELLGSVDSNSVNMYKRSKYVIEYLLDRSEIHDTDKVYLKSCMSLYHLIF